MEMAQEFPHAELLGIDLTSSAQHLAECPPHCQFQVGNVLNGLPFEDEIFDFVHQRLLMFAIPQACWPSVIAELVRVTQRGGWIELVEVSPFFEHAGPATQQVLDLIVQASYQRALDPAIAQHIQAHLGAARLKHVGISTQLVPLGNWGGQLGKMALANIQTIVHTMKTVVVGQLLTTAEEYEHLTVQIGMEVEEYHTTFTFHIVYGQRH